MMVFIERGRVLDLMIVSGVHGDNGNLVLSLVAHKKGQGWEDGKIGKNVLVVTCGFSNLSNLTKVIFRSIFAYKNT